ncbi:Colanic acid biosysnthesis glycosyl transferase WcaI [Dissulfuribacter thermophilus]|uniref:Colanic acid biosysnthesis glycosyl transferase WcaI n=1 Tax=Dissulfuribacter thermophilus TaxID=1156395 RepID=A0A1B9F784_9BACT|nr:glycosyltransferase WbuB [Dissulfuribacter thermophilus]OCC15621.1 Colanic acid biosysnthesis glycosyl transferase WcaI [Dissulfuribacter thermophilus]
MMRILIYGINYAPELTGIGKYTGDMAVWLAKQGHEVRVVTAPPYYPNWKIAKGYAGWRYIRESINGVNVWRCPLYVPKLPTGLKRLVHLASFAVSSLPIMLRHVFWKPDVVFVIEPPFFCAPSAWLVARLTCAQAWLHIQDFELDAAFELGLLSKQGIKKIAATLERWLMRRFDRVSSISDSMADRLVAKGVPPEKIVLFPNWADTDILRFDKKKAAKFRKKNGLKENDFIILYSGNMGHKQGLEIVLEAARKLKHYQEIKFILCGEGAVKRDLQSRALRMHLTNIMFLPLQPQDAFIGMLSAADLHLVIQRANAADLVLPSKLTNILSVGGLALVTTEPDTELGRLAAKNPGIFFTCPPDNSASLTTAIERIFKEKKHSISKGPYKLAREYAEEHFNKENILKSFLDQFKHK